MPLLANTSSVACEPLIFHSKLASSKFDTASLFSLSHVHAELLPPPPWADRAFAALLSFGFSTEFSWVGRRLAFLDLKLAFDDAQVAGRHLTSLKVPGRNPVFEVKFSSQSSSEESLMLLILRKWTLNGC